MTTEARYDIVAIGNAIVDVISQASDDFLDEEQLVKGSMALIDAATGAGTVPGHGAGAGNQRRLGCQYAWPAHRHWVGNAR